MEEENEKTALAEFSEHIHALGISLITLIVLSAVFGWPVAILWNLSIAKVTAAAYMTYWQGTALFGMVNLMMGIN